MSSPFVLTAVGFVPRAPILEHYGESGRKARLTLVGKGVAKNRETGEWETVTQSIDIIAKGDTAAMLCERIQAGAELVVTAYRTMERWTKDGQTVEREQYIYISHHRQPSSGRASDLQRPDRPARETGSSGHEQRRQGVPGRPSSSQARNAIQQQAAPRGMGGLEEDFEPRF